MLSQADLFQVVTFATDPLRGNPAFVLSETGGASDEALVGACALLHAEIIAVIDGLHREEPSLRFFTEEGHHPGAGHATQAAAHIALRHSREPRASVAFRLLNGELRSARLVGDHIAIKYPSMPGCRVDRVDDLTVALGARPLEAWVAPFGYVAVFENPSVVATMQPDLAKVSAFDRTAVIATAPGGGLADIVIRVFAPSVGLPEDPVCGTAHRIIIPYWAERFGRNRLHSRHLSPRGGDLWCEFDGAEVTIKGESSVVIDGKMRLPRI